MAIGTVLLLATAGACSKSYTLAPDAGPDRPPGAVTDAGDASFDGTSSDVPQTNDVLEEGGAADGTSDVPAGETRPDGPDTDGNGTKADAARDATPELASGDAGAESHDEDAPADSREAGGDLPAESGPDGGDADGDDGVLVLSIPTIRDPAAVNHPPSGSRVQTSGVVTAVKSAGPTHTFFLLAANVATYAGDYIYVGSTGVTNLAPGAVVQVTGLLSNYRGIDQIDTTVGSFSITGVTTVPTPIDVAPADIATGGSKAAELQSMLVHLNTTVVASAATVGTDFVVTPGNLIITSFIANGTGVSPFPATVGQSFSSLTGPLYIFGSVGTPDYKLAPRSVADVISP